MVEGGHNHQTEKSNHQTQQGCASHIKSVDHSRNQRRDRGRLPQWPVDDPVDEDVEAATEQPTAEGDSYDQQPAGHRLQRQGSRQGQERHRQAAPQHHHITVGKVDQTDRAVDQRVTNSDQAQKAATGQANQTLLEEGGEFITATFFLGGFLGGLASVATGIHATTINYQLGYQTGLYALSAAVLGGIGSVPGAIVGGLLVGMVRAASVAIVGPRWAVATVFLMLMLVLAFRPQGLFGRPASAGRAR
ncbi:MAG: branched-chain amino acid ABC transporter permease [Planctomycetia bacterium]|nr:branched-chain amino acid ABC transporter permease [Planctomycetia bacterium]